ncbi:ORF3 [Turkey adenovirus 3]|uniref:Uncharacterized protein n=1 Tax=Turkey adenovirus 3 TaxID=41678 RepID=Q9YUR9_9ADEN|nr:hypothetical protein TaV3gp03 [Turkey adenovirus 3]AAC64541.1 ORF3 [Turkey adenovirus 3]
MFQLIRVALCHFMILVGIFHVYLLCLDIMLIWVFLLLSKVLRNFHQLARSSLGMMGDLTGLGDFWNLEQVALFLLLNKLCLQLELAGQFLMMVILLLLDKLPMVNCILFYLNMNFCMANYFFHV